MKTLRENIQLNGKRVALKKGAWDPSDNGHHTEEPPDRGFQGVKPAQQLPS